MKSKGRSRRLGTIDLDTGEVLEEGVNVWVNAKVKWKEDWFMGFQEAFIEVASDKDMTQEMTRVWLYMLGKLAFENWIAIQQKEIASKLDMKPSNVSRALNNLVKKGLIIKGPKLGRSSAYKLNSKYGWKGKVVNLSKERHLAIIDP